MYIIEDAFGNIQEVELSQPPVVCSWTARCAGSKFTGNTREDVERKLVSYMEQNTKYRGICMIAKHIGYQLYRVDADGRYFPVLGHCQGPFTEASDDNDGSLKN